MLKQKLISVDEKEWQELGQKVGTRNRSQWIREQIHDMVKLPDSIEALQEEKKNTEEYLNKITGALMEKTQKEQSELKALGESEERFNKALTDLKAYINETLSGERDEEGNLIRDKNNQPLKEKTLGRDKIEEISEAYGINTDELESECMIKYRVRILKYHELKVNKIKDQKAIKRLTI